MTAKCRYCREERDAIAACALDDFTLLYHRTSGQTHMVISPVPEILDALDEAVPRTAAQVHDRLADHYDLGDADSVIAVIDAHLAELTALGLARRL
ncbi:HPr-rel-A system PqqD family peptide chaperone [Sphingobium vermicomposti]|uniref:PqqD family protein of HPr-rel-A system n=1 Tax=Sphingobium vermicomposti TaxID=529005 RepID=A0A846LYY6_9SPHN|nr:PqqD family protein of HPr-rel-A system [Sphingobium vermicomposti]